MSGAEVGVVFLLTAYTCEPPRPCITRAGTPPVRRYTIACDPEVLPLHTIVKIDGDEGPRRCQDTGGKIKGRRIDIYTDDPFVARAFGVQRARVHVIWRPPAKGKAKP